MRRQGGFLGNFPEVKTFIIHAIIGHPVAAIKPDGLYGYWCDECGQSRLDNPDDVSRETEK